MKKKWLPVLALVLPFALAGCWGNTSQDNELTGQAKKVSHNTPLICEDYDSFDVSMGVMQNGTGSMSSQDIWMTVGDRSQLPILKKAVETGAIVKITFDVWRWAPCKWDHVIRSVEIVPPSAK